MPNSSPSPRPNTQRSAWVAGATGLVGRQLLAELAQDKSYTRVVALARKSFDTGSAKIMCYVADFERLDELEMAQVDDAFCALGTTIKQAGSQEAFYRVDFDYCLAFAKAAAARGARRFVLVSALGANARSKTFYLRVKGEIENAVAALAFEAVHVLRPSFLDGEREQFRLGERLLLPLLKSLNGLLPAKYRVVPARVVARALLAAAKSGESGFHIHESDVIQAYGIVRGEI